jgi:ferritin
MKLKKIVQSALNDQLNREYSAAYLYLAMSAFFEERAYPGFAQWMRSQSKEEHDHMMRIYRYIFDRGGIVVFKDIKAPTFTGKEIVDVVKYALEQEKKVSQYIYDLVDLSQKEKDHATTHFLQWFIEEQVEEEASFSTIEQKMTRMSDNQAMLYLLDKELASSRSTNG